MIAVIQRVNRASVQIAKEETAAIDQGFLVLLGIETEDNTEDIQWLSKKIVNMRLFNDQEGVMNVSLKDAGGALLLVSQFTLHASTKKGNRPSYLKAARPEVAIPIYEEMIETLQNDLGKPIATGSFGADMQVALENDGPVTIIVDTKDKK